jgi:hypothetical protein
VKPFTYTYQGQIHTALSDHFLIEGYKSFMISSGELNCTIMQSEIPGPGGTIEWMQKSQPGELPIPRELIQALGEGLHDAEVI